MKKIFALSLTLVALVMANSLSDSYDYDYEYDDESYDSEESFYSEEGNMDSLKQLAEQVYIEEKISKALDHKLVDDEPYYTQLYYRLLAGGYFSLDYDFAILLGANVEYHPKENIAVHGIYNRGIVPLLLPIEIPSSYNDPVAGWIELPFARPDYKPYYQNIELGGTYFFSQERAQVVQPQIYRANRMLSTPDANVTKLSYFEHKVTIEQSYGARAGLIMHNSPVYPKSGVDDIMVGINPETGAMLTLDDISIHSTNMLQTQGWTTETIISGYLGIARLLRQGSAIEATERKHDTKYTVEGYRTNLIYADLMFAASKSLESVNYYDFNYNFSHGKLRGQVGGSVIGFRIGYVTHTKKGIGFPYSAEIGKRPGTEDFYAELKVGIGGVL
ncbi:MAG: hypothetical protein GX801_04420 [Fibrobacter sp.]|nr:hypothetical protein [Fibrobacter sp.]